MENILKIVSLSISKDEEKVKKARILLEELKNNKDKQDKINIELLKYKNNIYNKYINGSSKRS